MKPERIEELLKLGLSREVPEQMRVRVLSRVAEGNKNTGRRLQWASRLAFAALLVAAFGTILFCASSDSRRCERLQALVARPADVRIAALMPVGRR
jgi:hypothetical protein